MPQVIESAAQESGQALVEFALILPMLALLTFGTLEVSLYLQHASALNGAAFLAARSASVVGNQNRISTQNVKTYADATGMAWLGESCQNMKAAHGADYTRFRLEAKMGLLASLLQASGGGSARVDTIGAVATLPLEYDPKRQPKHTANPTYKPKTHCMVSYDAPRVAAPKGVGDGLKKLAEVKKVVVDIKAKWPKAPAPPPPAAMTLIANLPTGPDTEPFGARLSVAPRPVNESNGERYLRPDYEKATGGGVAWRVGDLKQALEAYATDLSKASGIKDAFTELGRFPQGSLPQPAPPTGGTGTPKAPGGPGKVVPPVPPTIPTAALAALLKPVKQLSAPAAEALQRGSNTQYARLVTQERRLFR